MNSYDALRHDPPAPVAQVTLRNTNNSAATAECILLLDTGADVTLLPRSAVARIGVKPESGSQYQLTGFDGSTTFASVAVADMIFLNRVYRGKYLLIEQEEGVLGRDVLNHLLILLNGPKQEWSQVT